MHNRTSHTGDDLKAIWEKQGGTCHFTGWPLDQTAHLDHIVPVKRGGTHEISNLRWTNKQVNYAKRDMLDGEFLNVIQAIAERLI
jgi:5-methylcytosine-specific restriction endonuclease McrA